MPSGTVHAVTGALLLGGGLVAVAYDVAPVELAAGLAVGVLLTPDIDIDHRTAEEARLWRIPALGLAWQVAWYPYALIVRHRSWFSHWPIVGTLGRLLYLLALLSLGGAVVGQPWWWAWITAEWAPWALAGWATQDMAHWAMDKLFRGD